MAHIPLKDSLTITAWLCKGAGNEKLNAKRLGCAGNYSEFAVAIGNVAGVR
jgi:hypothetical protein